MTLKELLWRTICMICEYWMPLKSKESEYRDSPHRVMWATRIEKELADLRNQKKILKK